jgi:mannose-6-phosphate isomerase-like protein (cupin superfamily)
MIPLRMTKEALMSNADYDYDIHTDVKCPPLTLIDVDAIRASAPDTWFNQTLARINDCVLRLGIVEGEFHWHKHDNEDELFYVVAGKLHVDVENGPSVELLPNQGYLVPKGVVHRTRALERTAMLMIEGATVTATGD